jgi:hypothetical protein
VTLLQAQFDAAGDELLEGKATLKVSAKGENTLVMTFQLLEDVADVESELGVADGSEEVLATLSSMGIENPVIEVVVLDKSGAEIFTQEFK